VSRGGKVAALAALFLAGFSLRPQLIGVGPLLPELKLDLGVSHAVAGLLVTIPVVCMAVCSPPGPLLAARFGSRTALALCLAVVTAFGALRAAAPDAWTALALTLPIGIAMGFAGTLMAVATKELFPTRPAFATGVYATGLALASSLASAGAVPIADGAGGWRGTLLVFAAVSGGMLAAWLLLVRSPGRHERVRAQLPRLPLRNPVAWGISAAFAFEAFAFYGISAWLPGAYIERGWSDTEAGVLLAVVLGIGLPSGVLVTYLADRIGSRRQYLMASAGLLSLSTFGFAAVPAAAWVWGGLAGAALGALFPLLLTLPLDIADEPRDVGAAAGMMLAVGYLFSASAPLVLGAIRDATGSFEGSLWALFAVSAACFAASAPLSRARLHRGIRGVEAAPVPPLVG
jgi:CP family cyanate transporter-like MFS transporter